MPAVHAFHVVAALPEPLAKLRELAFNLRWAWDHETIELFRALDRELWETSGHNPVLMLGSIAQERLAEAAQDETFLAALGRVHYGLETYLKSPNTWYQRTHAAQLPSDTRIAYFSMEFGLTECLPVYSGGLGVLAGDHLKSSSDLGIPLVGVGLLYQQGYFRQFLTPDGWQQERYPNNDFYNMPLTLEHGSDGQPLTIKVEFPGRDVVAQIWRVQVGRTPLYLLDTNIDPNSGDDQDITDKLYGGDLEMRLRQEMLLGIGGMRALTALGIAPTVCHMNEGHAAFLSLERTRMLMQSAKSDYAHTREATASGGLFTTHTPVPAGFDIFPPDLLGRYFSAYVGELGISFDDFVDLGRLHPGDGGEKFNMAIFAMRHAHHVNAVSKLHGLVTRKMVQAGYPDFPEDEVPVASVTNGIHTRSFISEEMASLLDRYLGGRWSQDVSGDGVWAKVESIPDEELWRVRERRREKLVHFARTRLRTQYEQRNRSEEETRRIREVLNPEALTIGFARRFATYKRATLLLSDPDRLLRLLNNPERPVQLILSGKSHPRDDGGKRLIQQIVQFAQRSDVRDRIVFLEDYDMAVARQLVQGVDIWLNTPRRPMEASGTSGMKVLANGGLNVSILDGWWAEAYNREVGWAIGRGEQWSDEAEQDRVEANALYELLEKEVVPLFYDRNSEGLPRAWVARVKQSMRQLCPVYNTHRMVSEYAERFYFPITHRYDALSADGLARARALVEWKQQVRSQWPQVKVESVEAHPVGETPTAAAGSNGNGDGSIGSVTLSAGQAVRVVAMVRLGSLTPKDVTVQAYAGKLDNAHQVKDGTPRPLSPQMDGTTAGGTSGGTGTPASAEAGLYRYTGDIPFEKQRNAGLYRTCPSCPRRRPTAAGTGPADLGVISGLHE